MSNSKIKKSVVEVEEEEVEKYKCDKCPKKFAKQYFLNQHVKYYCAGRTYEKIQCKTCPGKFASKEGLRRHVVNSCPGLTYTKIKCEFCPKSFVQTYLRHHVSKSHPDKLDEYDCEELVSTPEMEDLSEMLQEIGDPGGIREIRAGVEFLYDFDLLIIRWAFEEVHKECIGVGQDKNKRFYFRPDKFLTMQHRFGEAYLRELRGREEHFAHVVCQSYHCFDEQRKDSVARHSVGAFQHSSVNKGAWGQLEISFKFLALKYRTFVISGTVLAKHPPLRGTTKKIGVASHFFKMAVVRDTSGNWKYDGYVIPNEASSTHSPNSYRKTLADINKISGFEFLTKIKDTVERADLFSEGNHLKWKWRRENPTKKDDAFEDEQDITSQFDDSTVFMEEDDASSETHFDENVEVDKDAKIKELEERNSNLEAEVARLTQANASLEAELKKLKSQPKRKRTTEQ